MMKAAHNSVWFSQVSLTIYKYINQPMQIFLLYLEIKTEMNWNVLI